MAYFPEYQDKGISAGKLIELLQTIPADTVLAPIDISRNLAMLLPHSFQQIGWIDIMGEEIEFQPYEPPKLAAK